MRNIGIVCEGPTDYILLQSVTDYVLERNNRYKLLQPEPNLMGEYGNGWKGEKKHISTYREMSAVVCDNWEAVKELCTSAVCFEDDIRRLDAACR